MFHRKNELLRAGTGLAVAGALLTVYRTGTTTKPTLYATNDALGATLPNPMTTDVNGEYSYYIANGIYDEAVAYGSVTDVEQYIQMYDLSVADTLVQGFAFHCTGAPTNGEVIGGGIAPYDVLLSAGASTCKALNAATAITTLTIKFNGATIGTITFPAGGITGTVAYTAPAITAGGQLAIHNQAVADATLANIDGLLRK